MFCKAQILGNLGRAAEVRLTAGGKKVATVGIAVNEKVGQAEKTHWFNIVAWERLAEVLENYTTKGSRVLVSGRLTSRSYVNSQGATVYVTEVVAEAIELLDTRQAGSQNAPTTAAAPPAAINPTPEPTGAAHRPGLDDPLPEDGDNDLPF